MIARLLAAFLSDKKGATAIEYGLIATLISVGLIVALTNLGGVLNNTFMSIGNSIEPK